MLDNKYTIETPELVELTLSPASVWSRSMAFTFDFIIRVLLYAVLSIVYSWLFANSSAVFIYISLFLIEWFYPVFFEVWNDGATPGKSHYGIKVTNDDGTPVTFAASMLRNLLRVVDFLPFMYATGIIFSVSNPGFKRIGDLAAGTLVVHSQPPYKTPEIEVAESRPTPEFLSTEDQVAIVAFAERARKMSAQRRLELADTLSLLFIQDGISSDTKLLEIANGITGIDK